MGVLVCKRVPHEAHMHAHTHFKHDKHDTQEGHNLQFLYIYFSMYVHVSKHMCMHVYALDTTHLPDTSPEWWAQITKNAISLE